VNSKTLGVAVVIVLVSSAMVGWLVAASRGLRTGPGRVGRVRTGSDHYPIEAVFRIP